MAKVRYLLWDFGDTLVDQRWMWPSPPDAPEWTARYQGLADSELDARWNLGEMTTEALATALTADLGISLDATMAHIEDCCRNVVFFEHAWTAARARTLPQAIVTVNSDAFSRFVVPNYGLDSVFERIVTSWEERTLDKTSLCELAVERLGGRDPSEALLIDNIEANVDTWRSVGGQAYLFRGDEQFACDGPLTPSNDA
ncbi:MAG: HAD family hydrolase [Acidimicrobiia bacterium]